MDSRFEEVYGFPSDQFAGGAFINGNDVVALFFGPATTDGACDMANLNGTIIDVYGVLGEDGVGTVWEYTDGYAARMPGGTQSATFNSDDWIFGGVDSLQGMDDMTEEDEFKLMNMLTNPDVYECDGGKGGFVRGDCNEDSLVNIADGIFTLNQLFEVPPPPRNCDDACDSNNDGLKNIADGVYLFNFLFVIGSPPPPAPFPDCGEDTGPPDALGCESFSPCP